MRASFFIFLVTHRKQKQLIQLLTTFMYFKMYFLADRTNGRAYATVLRLSSVCRL